MAVNFVDKTDDSVRVSNVLISLSDKTGLDKLVKGLIEVNPAVRIYSTGGTFEAVGKIIGEERAGKSLVQVSDYTGQPEMQGGLVKTLDFKIYMGLLSETYNKSHKEDMNRAGAVAIDMTVVNLYPFVQTVAKPDVTLEQARANIDIGGPCMLRASAKNFLRVACVVDPGDYPSILDELKGSGGLISFETRFKLAKKAFKHTAQYDAAISEYLSKTDFSAQKQCYRLF